MCGIFGYCDIRCNKSQEEVCDILVRGLERIEYRGYDSAGVCVFDADTPKVYEKAVGKVQYLKQKLHELNTEEGKRLGQYMSIAHTRWATHGESTVRNAHPVRSDPNGTFYVVHNGIISNYKKHKEFLTSQGYNFETDTDTEVAAKLCLYHYEKNSGLSFLELTRKVLGDCDGQYAFLFLSSKFPGQMIAAQSGAPMIIGIEAPGDGNFEYCAERKCHCLKSCAGSDFFISSDIAAIIEHTSTVVYVNVDDIALLSKRGIEIYSQSPKDHKSVKITKLDTHLISADKGDFSHYMIKEIYEQCDSLSNTTRNRIDFDSEAIRLDSIEWHKDALLNAKRFVFVACGTSYHSSLATRKVFEYLSDRSVVVETASNFLDLKPHVDETDVVFFISQSGETADSIAAMNYCQSKKATTIGITNTQNSSIARLSVCNFDVRAGIEKGVASTKAYTSQFLSNILIALYISQERGTHETRRREIMREIQSIPEKVRRCLEIDLDCYIDDLCNRNSILVIGRGYQMSTCYEGSLKIKEISYIHSEGIMAGELKHGPLALVSSEIGIILIVANDEFYDKSQNAFEQIRARNGIPLVICSESIKSKYERCIAVPDSIDCLQGLLTVIPLQLISYKLAVKKGFDPDFPRNLAKSVTVE
ncbi:glutamine-fructose-6-phosphate transaminase (isomerizing) [Vittaforma corneae ATCC 50505]|uniref:glutamine--fructose-6-phosphate transaminase (isomerizing) n=1 Tax=Vittaforma corneae (strain ATCC 50505) TaxID=993615 RepID=L2GNP1_VITCO|nr:glutamine-fructose-6-phosphate transaminase (isomerizing) [Vittaforma corneae ATCC 50505]ELA41942.1 glutamine-fructose-6-phosphate transaminase (isomerizing) [Vittaforma corneae ATCC 50505]